MVDIVLHGDAAGQTVHVVDGAEDIVDDDVLGHQIVLMELDLLLQLLAGVLAQQLLQHVEADTLLDAALSQRIEVHIVAQVAHLVGLHPQRLIVHQNDHLGNADGVQQAGILLAQQVALIEEQLAGSGVCHRLCQLVAGDPLPEGQLLIELVPAHNGQIVAPGIEEQVVHQGLGSFHRGGLAGTELAVDLQHGVLIRLAGVLLQSSRDAGIVAEAVQDLRVGLEAQRPDQAGDGQLAVLVDTDPEHLVGVRLIFQPGTPIGDHRGGEDGQVGLNVDLLAVIHAGRTDDLRDHHALRAVDDEGAGVGHQGEIAHEDLLLLDLLRLLVPQTDRHLQGGGIRGVTGLALFHVILGGFIHPEVDEGQLQVALIVRDRPNVCENLPQTGVQKFPIGGLLDLQQVGHGHDFLVPGKILSEGFAVVLVLSHLHFHLSFAPPPCPAAGQVLYPIRSGELLNLFQFPIAFRWRMCYPVFVIRMGFHPLPFI